MELGAKRRSTANRDFILQCLFGHAHNEFLNQKFGMHSIVFSFVKQTIDHMILISKSNKQI